MKRSVTNHLACVLALFGGVACGGDDGGGSDSQNQTNHDGGADETRNDAPTCGDGVVQEHEACDGTDLGGATCLTIPGRYTGGVLGCTPSCAFDASGCTAATGQVQVVLFTHIEDNQPAGPLGSPENRQAYLALRGRLIAMAEAAHDNGVTWSLQPDWTLLEAARLYEDATVTASSGGKNLFVYLRDNLGAVLDPHSHEQGGYNYTDVAYLLDLLGVGGSTVIGGHIWDPSLPQFQHWDRFREPVPGLHYPEALWRGDILIGAGTPNHVNDPLVSGLWRPRDRDYFFEDDPAANIVAVGAWHHEVAGVTELVDLYANKTVDPSCLLTASWNITPGEIQAPGGIETIVQETLIPLVAMRDAGQVVLTDFTTLVSRWKAAGGEACLHQP